MSDQPRNKKRKRVRIPWIPNTVILFVLIAGTAFLLALRGGYIPARYSPTAAINVEDPNQWFVDWRIGELKDAPDLCQSLMKTSLATSRPIKNYRRDNGCGWSNAFRVSRLAGASVGGIRLSCPMAVAMTMWMAHSVQPAARKHLGTTVSRVNHFGGYACREIRGGTIGKFWPRKSEHSFANAIDVSGFRLANGRTISVLRNWPHDGRGKDKPAAKFLEDVFAGACKYMSVAIGPRFNKLHRDHFHFDLGFFFVCR